jgi:hypothetical protein
MDVAINIMNSVFFIFNYYIKVFILLLIIFFKSYLFIYFVLYLIYFISMIRLDIPINNLSMTK